MNLKQYIKKYGLTQKQVALKFSASDASVSLWLSGGRQPSYAMKKFIQAKTKGAIKENDWNCPS
jgi:transcriptional regulator with XRE-family HTH domain